MRDLKFVYDTLDDPPQIAYVEDERSLREVNKLIIEEELPSEVEVMTYAGPGEIYEALDDKDLDSLGALLTDYDLEGTHEDARTGTDVINSVKDQKGSYIHTGLITGSLSESIDCRSEDVYLSKPFEREELVALSYAVLISSAHQKKFEEGLNSEMRDRSSFRFDTEGIMDELIQTSTESNPAIYDSSPRLNAGAD